MPCKPVLQFFNHGTFPRCPGRGFSGVTTTAGKPTRQAARKRAV